MNAGGAAVLACALVIGTARAASAQVYPGPDAPHRGSIEAAGGASWASGFDVDTFDAELTRGSDIDGFNLFSTDGRVDSFPGAHGRIGVYLSSVISIEGGVRYSRPKLSYELSGDAESAADETAVETLSQYIFDGSVLFHFPGASFGGGRGVPFLAAGAGYIRELHEGNELIETGNELHATGGVKYWFGDGARRIGLRAEVGISSRKGGFDDEENRRTFPFTLVGLSFLF
jgi:hypothetical protein